MSEVDFDQIIDAVRKEIALPPVEGSLAALRAADGPKAADRDRPARRRVSPDDQNSPRRRGAEALQVMRWRSRSSKS